jgi:hypothetical protein
MVPAMPAPAVERLTDADRAGTVLLSGDCHTRLLIESLPVNVQAALVMALTTKTVKTADITRVLIRHGLPAKAENVARHRRRLTGGQYGCKCPRPSEATT